MMPKYRVFVTRKRTIVEHTVVYVNSTSANYISRDVETEARGGNVEWSVDRETKDPLNIAHVEEI